jgi:signal transduction histidine kinase
MVFQHHPDVPWFAAAAAVSAVLAALAWRRRRASRTVPAFVALMLGQTLWALGDALELSCADRPTKQLGLDLMIVGLVATPLSLLAFVLQYTGRAHWLRPRNLVWIGFVPVVTVILVWTNPWHHLYWRSVEPKLVHGAWTAVVEHGVWFWVNLVWCYAELALVLGLLLRVVVRSPGIYRAQAGLLIVGMMVPWALNVIDLAGFSPVPRLDLTSIAFCVTGLTVVPALLGLQILDVVPWARDQVVQGMRDAVIVLDPKSRIVEVNRAARWLLHLAADEIAGVEVSRAFQHWPALAERLQSPDSAIFQVAGPDPETDELFDASLSSLRAGDALAGRVLILQNATARRDAERQREWLSAEQAARAHAEAASRSKDWFLATLSHELRTPLAPVMAAVSAMLDDPAVPAWLRPTLELVGRNVALEARLIDDLLDLTRITEGKLRLDFEVVDAHALIVQARDICAEPIEASGQRVVLDLRAEAHHTWADPARLQQVFWNLINNAVKFSPRGGTLTIRTSNGAAAGAGPCRLVIEISDTGIGIAPEGTRSRGGTPYFQGFPQDRIAVRCLTDTSQSCRNPLLSASPARERVRPRCCRGSSRPSSRAATQSPASLAVWDSA